MWKNKVVWSEGMFLQPQHFQQQERYFEQTLEGRIAPVAQYGWGFAALELDESLLGLGRVGLARAKGIFPDGTPFDVPGNDPAPSPLDVPPDARDQAVVLAVPLRRRGAEECDLANSDETGLTRFAVAETEAADVNTGGSLRGAPVQIGRLRTRLILARDAVDAYATLGVARITERRSDNRVELDAEYIPPMLDALAHPRLAGWIHDLQGRLHHRGEMLARDSGQPGARAVSEVTHFFLLQAVNRLEPLFSQFARSTLTHPLRLYETCLMLAGELATFTHQSRRPLSFPEYQHDALDRCFPPLIQDLQSSLGWAPEERAIRIDLEVRPFNLRLALIRDPELLRSATLVVAAKAQMPSNELQQTFPRQVKLGPAERIRDLVNLNLPGIGMRLLPVAPRQIPYHADFHYFTVERSGELWKQLETSRALALHVAGEFPELELECWAIRE